MFVETKSLDLEKYIYRIISYERLIEMFKNRQNVLVKPKLWEDTFENFVLNSRLKVKEGSSLFQEVEENIYGQCWTLEKASDAMWRIFSPNKDGIRIRTTIKDLINSVSVPKTEENSFLYTVGKVKYLKERKLIANARKTFEMEGSSVPKIENIFESVLMKRKAFKHENEIRLLMYNWTETNEKENLYKYSIEPHSLISQLMVDPRVPYNTFKELKQKIEKDTGYKGSIKRSSLYRLPEDLSFNIGEIKKPKNT